MDEAGLAGRELGGYRLLREAGAGSASLVYLAQRLDQPAALAAVKVFDAAALASPALRASLRERFKREAAALARLRHPRIVEIEAFGEDGDLLYLVMPYLDGGTLAVRIAMYPHGMSLSAVSTLTSQIASALDFAHTQGVIHRDIKPGNILLDAHGDAYLADFGIARLLESPIPGSSGGYAPLTATGQALGTPLYMAPEQAQGARVGPAADVYALGATLYQMVTGSPPFQGDTAMALALRHLNDQPAPPRAARPDLPPRAEAVILRALAKRPEDRFASAGALASAFGSALDVAPPSAIPNAVTVYAPTPPRPSPALPPGAMPVAAPGGYTPAYGAMTAPALAPQSPGRAVWGILGAVALIAILLAGVGYANWPALSHLARFGPAPTATVATPAWEKPVVPAGAVLYATSSPGPCDQRGGAWATNGAATQSCQGGALIMSSPESDGAIGVATLGSIPSTTYPAGYVAQVRIAILGGVSSAKFGFKFRQQSVQDTGSGRGGYSFLVDPNGQWQFNRYSDDGTRNIVDQQNLPAGLQGQYTLDVMVSGNTFTFYINGQVIAAESDATYSSGFLCLAIEPGATTSFSDLTLYATP